MIVQVFLTKIFLAVDEDGGEGCINGVVVEDNNNYGPKLYTKQPLAVVLAQLILVGDGDASPIAEKKKKKKSQSLLLLFTFK